MKSKRLLTFISTAACVLAGLGASIHFTGCVSPENRQLEASGPYQGDFVLWAADSLIVDIGDAIVEVEKLAERNPAVAARPDVAKILAEIHRQRDGVVERNSDGTISTHEVYALLILSRDAYAAAKTSANASDLQSKTVLARSILMEAKRLAAIIITPQ
jgi:hypothetical protein